MNPRFTPTAGLRLMAVVLMLAGAVMIFATDSAGLAFAVIAVGIAIVAVLEIGNRCDGADAGHGGATHT